MAGRTGLSRSTPPLLAGARARWAGALPFADAHDANLRDARQASADGVPRLLLFEVDRAVLTLGRRVQGAIRPSVDRGGDRRGDLAETLATCAAHGIPAIAADRGGQATLHLPGQLIVFVAVPCPRAAIAGLVDTLLDGAAALAAEAEVAVDRGHGVDTGLWLGPRKLASVGLRHEGGVARHGLSLNVAIDAALSPALRLCGHQGAGYVDLAGGAARSSPPPAWLAAGAEGAGRALLAVWGLSLGASAGADEAAAGVGPGRPPAA